jgi:cobalt-zinc-cadmium efflux system membrane fusion protein
MNKIGRFILSGIIVFLGIVLTQQASEDSRHPEEHDHEEHGEEHVGNEISLQSDDIKKFGIKVEAVKSGKIERSIDVTGEVEWNQDRVIHIVPRVPGVVSEVYKNLGDTIKAGEVMALLESRELADMKSAYFAAEERALVAAANFEREEDLWKKKISSDQVYREAKKTLTETRIEFKSAKQKLHAIGFSEEELKTLHLDQSLTRFEVKAPIDGTIIEKHITLGEFVKNDTAIFIIADLNFVWINLHIYQRDLLSIKKGMSVLISAGHGIPGVRGEIVYMGSEMGEETRTTIVRVVLPNPDGHWRRGLFVNGKIFVEEKQVPVAIAHNTIQMINDEPCVFLKTALGFEKRKIEMGSKDKNQVEVVSGIKPGEVIAIENIYLLKSEIEKSEIGEGCAH